MDIRYSFLKSLDHLPSELIRTLWTIQSLDVAEHEKREAEEEESILLKHLVSQSEYLVQVVEDQIESLRRHRDEIEELASIRKRYDGILAKRQLEYEKELAKRPKLTVRINLKEKSKTPAKNVEEVAEEKYCICNGVSYGQMIACDNPKCPTEWFHYGCVGIVRTPVGKWYCSSRCRQQATRR